MAPRKFRAVLGFCWAFFAVSCADDPRGGEGVTYGGEGTAGDGDGDGNGDGDGDGDGDGLESCDPWAQDCPVGEKCVAASVEEHSELSINKCVPVLGEKQPGDGCSFAGFVEATDDCGADSYCWNSAWLEDPAELVGTCVAFCEGTAEQPICAPGTTCVIDNDAVLNLCVEGCDPVAQDCNMEPHDQIGCYIIDGDFICAQTTLDIPLGEPCEFINDCAPGGVCVPGASLPECAGENCCTAVCEIDGAQCSALPGTECMLLFEPGEAPIGFEEVGTCQALT
jgi:hypothetical protein